MKIPVIGERGMLLLDARTIARIRSVERSFQFQTVQKTYGEIITLEGWETLLKPLGFMRVHKNELVNLNLVRGYDTEEHTLLFEKNPGVGSIKALISRDIRTELREFLMRFDKS